MSAQEPRGGLFLSTLAFLIGLYLLVSYLVWLLIGPPEPYEEG